MQEVMDTMDQIVAQDTEPDPAGEPGGRRLTQHVAPARRIAIDLWRRPSSRPFAPPPEEVVAPGDAMDRLVVGLTVRDALESLSPAHRQVLELSYSGDLKQTEIAERLGLPLGTVKTRTYYALRALRLALEERGLDA